MEDLLARWQGAAWRAEADGWAEDVLAARGERLLGPGAEVKTRFWSVVRRYATTAGTVWLKECNPGQAFEGPLLTELAALEPGSFPAPLALDVPRGRLLLPDAGTVRTRDPGSGPSAQGWEDDLPRLLADHAGLQRRLVPHGDRLRAAGLPSLTPDELPGWLERLTDRLAALPPTDPQHLRAATARQVLDRLPEVRAWCRALGADGVPWTFQHDDLNPWNVARTDRGRLVWFDVGDSFFSHPFAVVQVPLAMATRTWPAGPAVEDPAVAGALDAYLGAWEADGLRAADLRRSLGPALRLAQAHRCESWRRLLAHVPPDRLGVEPPLLRGYLLRVVAAG